MGRREEMEGTEEGVAASTEDARAGRDGGRRDARNVTPWVPFGVPTTTTCSALTPVAERLPSHSTIAPARSHLASLVAMAITARRASEQNVGRRLPPPGSSPGILHQEIHQGETGMATTVNGDDAVGAKVSASSANVMPPLEQTVRASGVETKNLERSANSALVPT